MRFGVVYRQSRSCGAKGVSGCALRASTSVCRRCYKITASESTMGLCPLTKPWYVHRLPICNRMLHIAFLGGYFCTFMLHALCVNTKFLIVSTLSLLSVVL